MQAPIPYQMMAVIDIGSNSIRMYVAEVRKDGSFKIRDSLSQPVRLGMESFVTGTLGKESIRVACNVLSDFKKVMDTFQVSHVRTVATSAVREAANCETFINLVLMSTGIEVEVISDAEELRFNYIATLNAMKSHPEFKKKNSMIVDLGAGGTEVTVLKKGNISTSKNYRLGTLRMLQGIKDYKGRKHTNLILQTKINNTVELVKRTIPSVKFEYFIARGADIRRIAYVQGWKGNGCTHDISKELFIAACDEMLSYSVEKMVRKFGFTYEQAETLHPASLTFKHFAEAFQFSSIVIPFTSMRHGLLLDSINRLYGIDIDYAFSKQVVNSAIELGKKYRMDVDHSLQVARLSVLLFDKLAELHGMKAHERLLLEIAAILHDVGSFINERKHHLHSFYLVSNSDFIGLAKNDIEIIANLVLYHRESIPSPSDSNFAALSRHDRITVYKLAAILRVADSLDRSHLQIIDDFNVKVGDNKVVLIPTTSGVYEYEKIALKQKGNLFDSVFGREVVLQ